MNGLRSRLRAATADLHDAVEREIGLLDPDLDRFGYGRILQRLHRFHALVEPRIGAALGDDGFLAPRRRLPDLAADLAALGHPPESETPPPSYILPGPAEAMGALYVTEGSRLGGRLIARHVGPRIGLPPGPGLSYFSGAEDGTGALWSGFRARLEAHDGDGDGDRVVAAAIATFTVFRLMVCRPLLAALPTGSRA